MTETSLRQSDMTKKMVPLLSRTISWHEHFHGTPDSGNNANNDEHFSGMRFNRSSSLSLCNRSPDDERFVHVNDWFAQYGVNPCSRTETIYCESCRSEEPAQNNMDISTGHIVLVSIVFSAIKKKTVDAMMMMIIT